MNIQSIIEINRNKLHCEIAECARDMGDLYFARRLKVVGVLVDWNDFDEEDGGYCTKVITREYTGYFRVEDVDYTAEISDYSFYPVCVMDSMDRTTIPQDEDAIESVISSAIEKYSVEGVE